MVVMVAGILLLPCATAPLSLSLSLRKQILLIGWLGRTISREVKENSGNVAKQKALPGHPIREGHLRLKKVDLDGALERP